MWCRHGHTYLATPYSNKHNFSSAPGGSGGQEAQPRHAGCLSEFVVRVVSRCVCRWLPHTHKNRCKLTSPISRPHLSGHVLFGANPTGKRSLNGSATLEYQDGGGGQELSMECAFHYRWRLAAKHIACRCYPSASGHFARHRAPCACYAGWQKPGRWTYCRVAGTLYDKLIAQKTFLGRSECPGHIWQ